MKNIFAFLIIILGIKGYSQQEFPIYTDYLTDNYFLLHPSAAGMGNINKIRLTARTQWLDYENSPTLQTLSGFVNTSRETGVGLIIYNDKIGHFHTTGGQLSFAYHINMDNFRQQQLSFGISAVFQNSFLDIHDFIDLDQTQYLNTEKRWFFNSDVSVGYRNENLYTFYTIKNIIPNYISNSDNIKPEINHRQHFLSLGYLFSIKKTRESKSINPSFLLHYKELNNEWTMDSNLKFNFPVRKNEIWLGVSYRNTLSSLNYEKPQYVSVFMGGKINKFVMAYTYTHQANKLTYSTTGFHQITLGYNFILQGKQERFFDL